MDLGLQGLRAIVTGGSKGIGRRCAELFAAEGAHVALCARDAAEVDAIVAAPQAQGVTAFGQPVDVADRSTLETWVAASAAALGGIDIVVANVSALAVDDSEEAWRRGFETDLMHTIRTVGAALPYLEASKSASITIISSVSGRELDFTGPAYGALKAALVHYAQGLAHRLAGKGIRANTVSPATLISRAASGNGSSGTTPRSSPRRWRSTPPGAWRRPKRSPAASSSWRAPPPPSPPAPTW